MLVHRSRRILLVTLGLVSLLLLWGAGSASALYLPIPLEEKVDNSRAIVLGEVWDTESFFEGEKTISTRVTFEVEEYLEGEGPQILEFQVAGGEIGERAYRETDSPVFEEGNQALIFFQDTSPWKIFAGREGVHFLSLEEKEEDPLYRFFRGDLAVEEAEEALEETKPLPERGSQAFLNQSLENSLAQASPGEPQITGVSPTTISAGTDQVLTIYGENFGSTREGDYPIIGFRFYEDHYMYDPTWIRDWSDTRIEVEVNVLGINDYYYAPGSWGPPRGTLGFMEEEGDLVDSHYLEVSYGFIGHQWPLRMVPFYIDRGDKPGEYMTPLLRAANTWSMGGGDLYFHFQGETTAGAREDGKNVIAFTDLNNDYLVGRARLYYVGDNIVEADIELNQGADYNLGGSCPSHQVDLESVALHEIGHWLDLTDLYGTNDREKVMYGYTEKGRVLRDLSWAEREAVSELYPPRDKVPGDMVNRLAGQDRYQTALEVSQEIYPLERTADALVLAQGENFPDALAGVPLAHILNAPLLLVPPGDISPASPLYQEIDRVLERGKDIYLLGGEEAISLQVEESLNQYYSVKRLSGQDRFETAVEIARRVEEQPVEVFLVQGLDFPDALSVSSAASLLRAPVLLALPGSLPQATRDYLEEHQEHIRRIHVVGGEEALSPALARQLDQYGEVSRVAGRDRYETAALVAQRFFPGSLYLTAASGEDFPDALAGGVLGAVYDAPMLLVKRENLPSATSQYVESRRGELDRVFLLGGEASVRRQVEEEMERTLAP
ncbi:MAG: hypothetical protein D5R97_08040 [Candidatus Syntrophonatronum acetioxidans]|uniref:Peptidase M10 metallopeptidase domain-containing protein n=1 Tax=Candidatus Syntrophonatronum acetioxidans TaxID=1795816 RepID=A0A424YBS9_9FIRM|nr:MAG: hypothetical protein D5R97_08040 [Candidatus Syntrophonatronum acetioxidans]